LTGGELAFFFCGLRLSVVAYGLPAWRVDITLATCNS
ncbi:MAG: hypothetical protein ACI920_003929, partial [Saprospiraceae bacterium]